MTFDSSISTGNILTIIVIVGGLAANWFAREVREAKRGFELDAAIGKLRDIEQKLTAHEVTLSLFTALQVKVDTMWAFQMRRAISEVVEKGIGTMNSPMTIFQEARERLEPIKPRLIDFWETLGKKLSDTEAPLEIERQFGNELLTLVCVPCGLSHAACLIVALSVARQQATFDLEV